MSAQQAQLVMSTKGLTTAQQQAVLSQISLANATGTLTTSQMTSALITETRNEADAKALLLNAGLISSETAEATATNTVTAAKLRELAATGQLTKAEAQLLATKAGVTLENQKQASSFGKLGNSLKNVGNSIKSIAVNHPILTAITVVIGAITTAVTIAEKKNEEFIESQEKLIEKIDENISKYDDEISSLDSLQKKLQDAKGDKEALASIQSELNQAIGDTPGLLNEESNAYDIANQKIDDRIERLKELRKLELEDKVTAQKEIFNNTLVDNAWGIDHKFDYFSNHKIIASDTLGSEFSGYLEGINANRFETLQSIFEALKKNGYGNGEKSNAEIWKELIDSYGGAMLDVEEIQDYFDNQTEYAQKILSDYINNSESIFSKEELNSIIEDLVESGYSQDLEGIKSVITSLVENDELEKTINDYYESLYNDDIDSDALYQNIKSQFDTLVANYPELKGILENYFNSIGKDIKTGINNASQNPDEITVLSIPETIDKLNTELKPTFDSLKDAWENIFTEDGFTLENVDTSMLDDIKSTIDELNDEDGLNLGIDYTAFEELSKVLTNTNSSAEDVKNSMNSFASSIFNSIDTTRLFDKETASVVETLLESMGVSNAHAIVTEKLEAQTEALALQQQFATQTGWEMQDASNSSVSAFLNHAGASSVARTKLFLLKLAQDDFANSDLNAKEKISELQELATAYGQTAIAARIANLEKANTDGHIGIDYDKELASLMDYINNVNNVEVDYTPVTDKKSGKDSSKEFDWIETAVNSIEKDIERLDKTIDSAYTSAGEKSEALVEKLHKVNEEIKLQQQAYEGYMAKAESIGLSDNYKKLVQSGAINIETIKDEKLQKKIDEYSQWYEKAQETQDKINDLYEQSSDVHVESYEFEAEQLAKLRDKNLLNVAEYYKSMTDLQDQYYNSEALKLKDLADQMEAEYGRMSNINFTRPSVTSADMQSAGYTPTVESSSVHAMTFGNNEKQVVVTPILPDGTILSPEALINYATQLLNGEQIDANIQLAMFDGKNAQKQANDYVKGLESIQGEYAKLKETFEQNPYGDLTEKQLEAIEKLSEELGKIKDDLSSELGDIKSAYDNLIEIRDTYNEHGKISVDQYQNLCDMGFEYLALLSNESGALSLDEEAFQRLTDAKIQEMQVTMALQAADLINSIETEADAVQYLASSYSNLANEALNAAEQMLRASLINTELKFGKDSKQYQAAQTIVKGYENSKLLAGVADIKSEETEEFLESINWIERLLEKMSKATDKIVDKVDKFVSWQKKNAMINRAVKSSNAEIEQNKNAYQRYMSKANTVGLSKSYIQKIQNGSLSIEDITNEELADKIKEYQEWYDKAQDVKDTIQELYDQQRDLIRQKLDNVLDYYSDMDSYLTSITSKMESLVSLNDSMGKRSSLTELVEQFAEVNDRLSATVEQSLKKSVTEIDLGESESVKKAQTEDRQELVDSIQSEIDNLAITPETSGTYKKLLDKIENKEKEIQKYEDKGWDTKKAKKYAKLQKELQNYYDLRKELEKNTTSDTIANYSKIYTEWQKLQNKIDDEKTLNKSQQKKYDSYLAQMEQLKADKANVLSELYTKLGLADGSIASDTEAQKAQKEYDAIKSDLEGTATYKKLESDIKKTKDSLAELDKIGYDNLTNKQKKTYDKLTATLEDYYERKEALDEGATASNIAEYNKIYIAWRKLQDKLDAGKNLSTSDWKKYNNYTEQLKEFKEAKDDLVGDLQTQLDEALNPADKIGTIDREYEKASEEMYQSYQDQIDAIESELTDTTQYKNLLAKAQKLERKKDTKGLSKSEQATLDKYNAELEALHKGGNGANVSEYMSTWEKWYSLEQKLLKDGKLSDSNAKKYDEYKAKLEAWNNEKQTQINDLVSLMEDDLAALQKTYTENVAEAESQISDYYKNLYDYAKQIAEYNLTTLEAELSLIEACLSYYKELVSLHDNFSGNKLSNLMTDLGIDDTSSQEELYEQYIKELQNKYDTTLKKINEYKELISAAESEDYEGALTVFKNALDEYTKNGQTDMANKLQSVIDLLNTRMESGEVDTYDDLWKNEWEEALASAKTELIGIATNIQEVNDALREVKFSHITDAVTQLNNAQDVLSSIGDLINDDWVYDADGNLTQYGITKVGLLVEEINSAKQEVSKYAQLMKSIQEMQDTYASDEAYQTALQEAKMNYLTSLNDLQNYQDSVVAILTKADESIINSLKEVIAKRKEALQKQKELYDYGKNLKNSQKEIDAIQAQIDALKSLSGAMDSATKAKLAQLEADLAEKQEALQETKDDHTYNLQIEALDEFLESLDSTMSDTADSVNKSFESYVDAINSALEVYNQNKDYLDKWSDKIIKTTVGLGGDSFDNVDLKIDGLTDSNENVETPDFAIVNSDTVNAIESTSATTNDRLGNIQSMLQSAVNSGMLVRVADSPLLTVNPDMMNFLDTYIPPMAVNVNQHLPQIASRGNQAVVNVHYDSLIHIDKNSSIDEKFIKNQMPGMIEQSFKQLYREVNRLK